MSLGQVDSMVTNETASLCHCVHVLGIFKNVEDGHYVIRPLLSSSIYTYMHDTPLTMYLGVYHNCRSSPRDRLPLQPAPLCVRGGWLQDQGEPPTHAFSSMMSVWLLTPPPPTGVELQAEEVYFHLAWPPRLHQNHFLPQGNEWCMLMRPGIVGNVSCTVSDCA